MALPIRIPCAANGEGPFRHQYLIDYLNGRDQARQELARYAERSISVITWMEVMAGAMPDMADRTRAFLAGFNQVELDAAIAGRAVELRRAERIRLPDAIIWASADVYGMVLVTRNTKDFPADRPGIHVPYVI